jgi:hypothetical protein
VLRTGALLALLATSCMHHRGAGWREPVPQPKDPVSIVLLGDAGRSGRTAAATAEHLRLVLAAEREAGHYPKVLWLGDNVLDDCPDRPWDRPGSRELAGAVREHMQAGGQAYAVLGDEDRECPGLATAQGAEDGPHPWTMPSANYVVRVDVVGGARVVSQCDAGGCTLDETTELALVDLVVLDTAGYGRQADSAVPDADQLIAALRKSAGPPRILVTHIPVESAGVHGLGGAAPDATFRYLPPSVRAGLQEGLFAGVVSAHDRNQQVTPDLSDALMRSNKVATPHPVFQVVSGSVSDPDSRAPGRRIDRRRGITVIPVLSSDHAGFAVLQVTPNSVDVTLHARRKRSWESGSTSFPLQAAPFKPDRSYGSQTPCLDCAVVPTPDRP